MRTFIAAALVICASVGASQPPPGHNHGGPVLFLSQASGDQVVPRQPSAATATAAIIVDREQRQLRYDITYNGLERGPATRIGLYNYGAGGNGRTVVLLCGGGDAPACPERPAARLSGTAGALRWSGPLLLEFAAGRVYLQIDSGDGRPEIRGQLDANVAMVPKRVYVARLAPVGDAGATGEGTAVLSETYLPGDRVVVDYAVTVAGTSGRPEDIALVGTPRAAAVAAMAQSVRFVRTTQVPNARRLLRAARNGGTFSGNYSARRSDNAAVLAERLVAAGQAPTLAVRTSRFPRGELVGVFMPVE